MYNADETYVYFFKQPETPVEETAAENAMAICPQNAIGKDGLIDSPSHCSLSVVFPLPFRRWVGVAPAHRKLCLREREQCLSMWPSGILARFPPLRG